MKTISSSITFIQKYILLTVIFAVDGFIVWAWAKNIPSYNFKWLDLVFFAFLIALNYFLITRIGPVKKVKIDNHKILISNYIKTIMVDLAEMESVSTQCIGTQEIVVITFKAPTIFGKKIKFIPKLRFFPFSQHPIVEELYELGVNAGA